MSEIKEKYIEFIKNMYGLNEADFETALDPLHYFSATTAFIESNYIPREEHEKLRNFRDDLTDKTIQKLKEENELLNIHMAGKTESTNEAINKYEKLESSVKELLKLQRESGLLEYQKWFDAYASDTRSLEDVFLNAPEPSIQDLKCQHNGKINSGHHPDQPSHCDECGEDL